MSASEQFFSPSEVAARLGVSAKALRLYEQHGLVMPLRTEAGWRAYGPADMARLAEIIGLRGLGLTIAEIARLLAGNGPGLDAVLTAQQRNLEGQLQKLSGAVERVRSLRDAIGQGKAATIGDVLALSSPVMPDFAFDLPWPWAGERFEMRDIRPVNYITGPLGCGKTRLINALQKVVPGGADLIGLHRVDVAPDRIEAALASDDTIRSRVEQAINWIIEDGGKSSPELTSLFTHIEVTPGKSVMIDMVEERLDQETQQALAAYFRTGAMARTIFATTRSSAMLDLGLAAANEAIILCPANHSTPRRVLPYPGTAGYESVADCLAAPEVRARTAGVFASLYHSSPTDPVSDEEH